MQPVDIAVVAAHFEHKAEVRKLEPDTMDQWTGLLLEGHSLGEGGLPVMARHTAGEAYCTAVEVHSPAAVGGDSLVEGGSPVRHKTAGLDLDYHTSPHHIHGHSLEPGVLFERKE